MVISFIEAVLFGPVGDIDHASVPWSFLLSSVESLGEVFEGEVFVDGLNAVLGTEFKHVLDLFYRANVRPSDCDLVIDQVGVIDLIGDL